MLVERENMFKKRSVERTGEAGKRPEYQGRGDGATCGDLLSTKRK
jgi:hypothetical protein